MSLGLGSAPARAEPPPLSLTADLDGVALGRHVMVWEDVRSDATISRVSAAAFEGFKPSTQTSPSFGYSSSTYWLRLSVRNAEADPRRWLLEVGYPLLDEVTLYKPRSDGGFDSVETGDTLPFRTREVAFRDFVFKLEQPPGSETTYYVRARSHGSVSVPLHAWTVKRFIEHQHLSWTAFAMFYGGLLIMVLHGLSVFVVTRAREHLLSAGYMFSVVAFSFTYSGHTSQFVLPNHPELAQRAIPATLAAAILLVILFVRTNFKSDTFDYRSATRLAWIAGGLLVVTPLLPFSIATRLLTVSVLCLVIAAGVTRLWFPAHRVRITKLFWLAWTAPMIGVLVAALHSLGVLPSNFWSNWSLQIGISVQVILISSNLADKLNLASATLGAAHLELSKQVAALSAAVTGAEQATQRAARATSMRDEFMATMAHEFRTPLNAIINIPKGLTQEFQSTMRVVCTQCDTVFELEPHEQFSASEPCPVCDAQRKLEERELVQYEGDAERARRLLLLVEGSGYALLRVVNNILEFSKLEAGRLELAPTRFHVGALLHTALTRFERLNPRAVTRILCEPVASDLHLEADPDSVRDILDHLMHNAIKFSHDRGKVVVRAERVGDMCQFSVTDEGIGMPSESLGVIFSSFEQLSKGGTRKYGGTGLGLSISRALVRAHSGTIWATSTLHEGSTFFFSLPLRHLHESGDKPLVDEKTLEGACTG